MEEEPACTVLGPQTSVRYKNLKKTYKKHKILNLNVRPVVAICKFILIFSL